MERISGLISFCCASCWAALIVKKLVQPLISGWGTLLLFVVSQLLILLSRKARYTEIPLSPVGYLLLPSVTFWSVIGSLGNQEPRHHPMSIKKKSNQDKKIKKKFCQKCLFSIFFLSQLTNHPQ